MLDDNQKKQLETIYKQCENKYKYCGKPKETLEINKTINFYVET